MKRRSIIRALGIWLIFSNCGQQPEPALPLLDKIYDHIYFPQDNGLKSLSWVVTGSSDQFRQFARSFGIRDSLEVHVCWKAPNHLKARVFTRGKHRAQVAIPRWADFGLAFGLTRNFDALPLSGSKTQAIRACLDSLRLDSTAVAAVRKLRNGGFEISLTSSDAALTHRIQTTADYAPVSEQLIQNSGASGTDDTTKITRMQRHWLALTNGKAALRQQENRFGQQGVNQVILQLMYQHYGAFWLPEWSYEVAHLVSRGHVSYADQRLRFSGYVINPDLPDTLFAFPDVAQAQVNLKTPAAALNSLMGALAGGDPDAARACLTDSARAGFDQFLERLTGSMPQLPGLPDSLIHSLQKNALQWLMSKEFSDALLYRIQEKNVISDSEAFLYVHGEAVEALNSPYRFIRSDGAWRIDSFPVLKHD